MRSGHWLKADDGFRGLPMPVYKSGFGLQFFDLINFQGFE